MRTPVAADRMAYKRIPTDHTGPGVFNTWTNFVPTLTNVVFNLTRFANNRTLWVLSILINTFHAEWSRLICLGYLPAFWKVGMAGFGGIVSELVNFIKKLWFIPNYQIIVGIDGDKTYIFVNVGESDRISRLTKTRFLWWFRSRDPRLFRNIYHRVVHYREGWS